jgi:hypothetical protein
MKRKAAYPPEKCRCYFRQKNIASNAKRRKACPARAALAFGEGGASKVEWIDNPLGIRNLSATHEN